MVKSQILEPKKVCVDIGTGYYIKMSSERAINYFERRIKTIKGQIDQLMGMRQRLFEQIKAKNSGDS